MNTAELKLDLINRIANTKSKLKLQELAYFLNFQADESIYTLNKDEKSAIDEAKKQVNQGEVVSNKELSKEISAWLLK